VNKAFCKSASPRLFRYVGIGRESAREISEEHPIHWGPKRLFELSQSQYRENVREAVVSIQDCDKCSSPTFRRLLKDLAVLLPTALCNFPRLSSLSIKALGVSSNMKHRPSCPVDLQQLFTSIIANVLRYVPLHGLEELTLALPVTHDFATALSETGTTPSRTPADTVLQKIRHLDFSICDASGPRGERYFSSPLSPAQRQFPNENHAHKFFEIIQLATNLTSLRIASTHVLDMDHLDVEHLNRLRSLELSRLKLSRNHLSSIAERNEGTLRSFFLQCVELKSGTWTEVLLGLCRLPRLVSFHLESVGYAKDGDSSKWAPYLLPEIDDPRHIETRHTLDWNAYGNVQRHVMANRKTKGLPEIDSYDFKEAIMESVEDVLRRVAEETSRV
jgi:hypothetical protein